MKTDRDIFYLSLDSIQPSQLYISESKLKKIVNNYNFIKPAVIAPVPVKELDGEIVYTDGHTRAFALFQNGEKSIRVFWDEDDMDWEAYRICVEWCKDEGIYRISDLENRIVSPHQYDIKWLKRCRIMQEELRRGRGDGEGLGMGF